jgi:ATP-dependent DNA helicase RecQ
VTVVVSPLIALMKDQVDAARETGISAGYLNSTLGVPDLRRLYRSLEKKELKLLYLAPERLAAGETLQRLSEWDVSLVAIDEAHCISEWGHEFRPDYRLLSRLRTVLPGVPLAAFTATATRRVQEDVINLLGLREPLVVRASFDRPEIFYRIETKRGLRARIVEFVSARPNASGIIYRATRADVEKTAGWLTARGIDALCYHAGLPDEVRHRNQELFKRDQVRVIVATIAFGMGIDKPDIRYVVHGDLPRTLEAWYQETGRAGRDGDPAEALLLWGGGDLAKTRFHIDRMEDRAEAERASRSLKIMAGVAGSYACRHRAILAHFDEDHHGNCGACDVCAGEVETIDATEDARKLLSAIARTRERFGAHHVVDVVRGVETDKVRQRGHDRLPTFGVGRDGPKKYWLSLVDDLEARGYLYRDEDRFRALRTTGQGRELLFGREEFRTMRRNTEALEPVFVEELPFDEGLFETLRKLRQELASQRGIPPYMVFSNRTLRSMAAMRPKDAKSLLLCPGVGRKKLEVYGDVFLAEIQAFD